MTSPDVSRPELPEVECWLTDMDGVLVHEGQALPGAQEFFQRLLDRERRSWS